jgi:hypothetical protein
MPGVLSRDTTLDALAVQRAVLGRLSGPERARMAAEMSEDARELSLAGIRARNPSWSEARARCALLVLLYGADLVTRAWGAATES